MLEKKKSSDSFPLISCKLIQAYFFRVYMTLRRVSLPYFSAFSLADYKLSLWGLKEGSAEHARAKHEVHLRGANKLQDLCFRNGGIYIKLGQHIAQLVSFFYFYHVTNYGCSIGSIELFDHVTNYKLQSFFIIGLDVLNIDRTRKEQSKHGRSENLMEEFSFDRGLLLLYLFLKLFYTKSTISLLNAGCIDKKFYLG